MQHKKGKNNFFRMFFSIESFLLSIFLSFHFSLLYFSQQRGSIYSWSIRLLICMNNNNNNQKEKWKKLGKSNYLYKKQKNEFFFVVRWLIDCGLCEKISNTDSVATFDLHCYCFCWFFFVLSPFLSLSLSLSLSFFLVSFDGWSVRATNTTLRAHSTHTHIHMCACDTQTHSFAS